MTFSDIMDLIDRGDIVTCEKCYGPINGVMLGFDMSVKVYT